MREGLSDVYWVLNLNKLLKDLPDEGLLQFDITHILRRPSFD